MDIPALYVVLFFMGSVSTDPNVSLVQQSTTFHFSNDASGQKLCDESGLEGRDALPDQDAAEGAN
jgi:hypothetical protein